jgi:hypothetical protein
MKTMKIKVTDIVYPTDGQRWGLNDEWQLPSEMTLFIEGDVDIEDEITEEIADAISDKTGWLVESYNYDVDNKIRFVKVDNILK